MFDKSVELQVLEQSEALFGIVGCGTKADHVGKELFIDVLAFFLFYLALLEQFPASVQIVAFAVSLNQSCVAHRIGDHSVLLLHINHKPIGFLCAA